MSLENKNAIVYGAGGSIGREVAKAFAAAGARVYCAGRTRKNLTPVVKEITIPVNELGQGDDSHDANNKLDMDLVNQLVIIDSYGAENMVTEDNTLWINKIHLISGK